MRPEPEDNRHLIANVGKAIHWKKLLILVTIGFVIVVIYHQYTLSKKEDLELHVKHYKPPVCDFKNDTWVSIVNSEEYEDSCQKCEALQKLDRPCSEKSDPCELCTSAMSSIFFIDPSNSTFFNSRQACVIESAAKHHPETNITVYVTFPKDCHKNDHMKTVCSIKNVAMTTINSNEVLTEAGLPNYERDKLTIVSKYRDGHLCDVLRLAIIFKKGGMYLDLDTMILKPLLDLPYGFGHDGYVEPDLLENGVMKLPPKSAFVADVLKAANQTTVGNDGWIESGPTVLTRVFKEKCPDVTNFHDPEEKCLGMAIYPVSYFYAVPWPDNKKFFDPKLVDFIKEATSSSYGAHFWDLETSALQIYQGTRQGISALANRNCPGVFPNFATSSWSASNNASGIEDGV